MKFLMCQPDFYTISYEINPWMNKKHITHPEHVKAQWEKLYQTILHCGAEVSLIPPISGLPDMVFTANAGLLDKNCIYISHFKFQERQGEEQHFLQWFQKNGYTVVAPPPSAYFEGAGDALPIGNFLFAAYGFRSDKKYYEIVFKNDLNRLLFCELRNPYFYHLDTCFCPLNNTMAIWYPDAFSSDSQERMQNKVNLIAVEENEAKRFACNAIVIEKQIILPDGCPQITKRLQAEGFTVYTCDMHEFLKAGGACKCLTMRID